MTTGSNGDRDATPSVGTTPAAGGDRAGSALHFGPFAVDLAACRLTRDGVEVHLTPKAAAVLCQLLGRPGELISKDEFLEVVWEGVHVREESLTQAISVIRHALGDSAQNPQFIQTVSGEGYRFVGEVTARSAADFPHRTDPQRRTVPASAPVSTKNSPDGGAGTWRFVFAAVVATIAVAAAAWIAWPDSPGRPSVRSIAVMPLEHLSGDNETAYFTDAMTELLSARLERIGSLTVIAPSALGRLDRERDRPWEIAKDLGADALIDGSVLVEGEQVRIVLRLVDGSSGEQLEAWTRRGARDDILSVQGSLALAVVNELEVALTAEEEMRLAYSPEIPIEAIDAWALGTSMAMNRLGSDLAWAAERFEQALRIEPEYVDAWVGLGISHVQLATYGLNPPEVAYRDARRAALEALDRDPAEGRAHITLAWIQFVFDQQFDVASASFARGLEWAPNYFGGRHQYAWFQMALGEFDEATRQLGRARVLDPSSLVSHAQSATPPYFRRDFDTALEHARRARLMDPNFGNAHVQLGRIYLARDDAPAAIEALQRAYDLSPHPRLLGDLALAYGADGRGEDARRVLAELEKKGYVEPLAFAWAHLGVGDRALAIEWLERAIDHGGSPLPLLIEWDPKYDILRGDPDFDALVERVRELRSVLRYFKLS